MLDAVDQLVVESQNVRPGQYRGISVDSVSDALDLLPEVLDGLDDLVGLVFFGVLASESRLELGPESVGAEDCRHDRDNDRRFHDVPP